MIQPDSNPPEDPPRSRSRRWARVGLWAVLLYPGLVALIPIWAGGGGEGWRTVALWGVGAYVGAIGYLLVRELLIPIQLEQQDSNDMPRPKAGLWTTTTTIIVASSATALLLVLVSVAIWSIGLLILVLGAVFLVILLAVALILQAGNDRAKKPGGLGRLIPGLTYEETTIRVRLRRKEGEDDAQEAFYELADTWTIDAAGNLTVWTVDATKATFPAGSWDRVEREEPKGTDSSASTKQFDEG